MFISIRLEGLYIVYSVNCCTTKTASKSCCSFLLCLKLKSRVMPPYCAKFGPFSAYATKCRWRVLFEFRIASMLTINRLIAFALWFTQWKVNGWRFVPCICWNNGDSFAGKISRWNCITLRLEFACPIVC